MVSFVHLSVECPFNQILQDQLPPQVGYETARSRVFHRLREISPPVGNFRLIASSTVRSISSIAISRVRLLP